MSSPTGVAAIKGLSVGQERKLLQLPRKFEAGSHVRFREQPFCPHTFYVKTGNRWITAAELTLAFRRGQRMKTRFNKARKAQRKQAAAAAAQAAQAATAAAKKNKEDKEDKEAERRQGRREEKAAGVLRRSKRRRTQVQHYSK